MRDVVSVTAHPKFDLKTMLAHRATADVALIKLAAPLPRRGTRDARARHARSRRAMRSRSRAPASRCAATAKRAGPSAPRAWSPRGRPGNLQIRLVDPATKGETAGLGACTGDSGAPVFAMNGPPAVIGVVSWSTGPGNSAGCGGLTGVTPLFLYRDWVTQTVKILRNEVRS